MITALAILAGVVFALLCVFIPAAVYWRSLR